MKNMFKFIFWNGLSVWVILIGGMMMVMGGINDVGARSIFDGIAQTWDNGWTMVGTFVTAIGAVYALVQIGFAIYNSVKK